MPTPGPGLRHARVIAVWLATWVVMTLISWQLLQQQHGQIGWYLRAGLSLALLLSVGPSYAPLVFLSWLGTLPLVSQFPATSVWMTVARAAAFVVPFLTGTLLLRATKLDRRLRRFRDVVLFLALGVLVPTCLYALALWALGLGLVERLMGSVVSLVSVTPFLLVVVLPRLERWWGVSRNPPDDREPAPAVNFAVVAAASLAIGAILWTARLVEPGFELGVYFACFIPLVWVAASCALPTTVAAIFFAGFVSLFVQMPASAVNSSRVTIMFCSIAGLVLGGFEEERRRAAQLLRQSEQRYRSLVEASPDALMVHDRRQILYVNSAAVSLFGAASADELLGRDPMSLADASFHATLDRRLDALTGEGRAAPLLEIPINRLDGTRVDIESVSIASTFRGRPAIQVMARDITSRRVAEQERARLEQQLRQSQKLESLGRLAGGVAHDFNNLLTVINGYCDLLLGRLKDPDPVRPRIQQIRKAGAQAASLTQQLMTFSRKQLLQPQALGLNSLVADSESMLRLLLGEGCELSVQLAAARDEVLADPAQLHRILMNLSANARDAMPAGGRVVIETCNADVSARDVPADSEARPGFYVVLTVKDTGMGMDENTRSRAFEPFFTTKAPGKGTGLGLATVYGAVRQSGGFVVLDTEVGQGTTFRIYLPRTDAPLHRAGNSAKRADAEGRETVLVVEDHDDVRELVVDTLESRGYQVLAALSGDAAIETAAKCAGKIDLLVTDVVMPGIHGPELAEVLLRERPDLQVLFISGYAEDALSKGSNGSPPELLAKPFAPEALAAKVREVLDQRG